MAQNDDIDFTAIDIVIVCITGFLFIAGIADGALYLLFDKDLSGISGFSPICIIVGFVSQISYGYHVMTRKK